MATSTRQQFEFKAEMKQLLHLIANSLYTNPEVFLRELVSNASDALNKVRFMQITGEPVQSPKLAAEIRITVDDKKHTFSIEDTGIGMTYEDLTERLGTVASSGTLKFVEQLKEQKQNLDGNMIGQFGVGFYSAFMVAEEITVETRHANPQSGGLTWISDGQGTYEIEEADRAERGTRISFTFRDEHKEFARADRLKQLINKYSNFVDYPILVNGEQVNEKGALWHKNKSDVTEEERASFYTFLTGDSDKPLDHLHLSLEGRINFKAMVFVPPKARPDFFRTEHFTSLQLYSNRVFVREDCKELLPEYLRFAEGIVDSEDLPLNVSREVTQSSPVMTRIREVLTNKILTMIEGWAKDDADKLAQFYREFGPLFKSGINSDFANRDRLIELLRFHSTKSEEQTISLKTYTEHMGESQKEIYYLSGDHLNELRHDPRLEYFRKKEIEVLLLHDPVDVFVVPGLGTYQEKPLKSIEKADLDLEEDESGETDNKVGGDALSALVARFKEVAGDRVEDVVVSKRLVDSAVTLTVGKEGLDSHLEKMMKMMDQDTGPSKRVLEINPPHPVIKNMSRLQQGGNKGTVDLMARQLYEGALLLQGDLDSPAAFVKRMTDLLEKTGSGS